MKTEMILYIREMIFCSCSFGIWRSGPVFQNPSSRLMVRAELELRLGSSNMLNWHAQVSHVSIYVAFSTIVFQVCRTLKCRETWLIYFWMWPKNTSSIRRRLAWARYNINAKFPNNISSIRYRFTAHNDKLTLGHVCSAFQSFNSHHIVDADYDYN